MYQLIKKDGSIYWVSKEEAFVIRQALQKGVPFVTMSRYDKTINSFDIKELTVPDWALPMLKKGHKIEFSGDNPIIRLSSSYMIYEDNKWVTYEGVKLNNEIKSFEDYISSIKRLD